jgi:hypothetical protein
MTPIAADWHDGQINLTVMAGHSRLKDGVASARMPGHQVLLAARVQDVDARDKLGHDETG